MSDPEHKADNIEVEPDLLPLGALTAWVIGLTAIVIVLVLGLWQYFYRYADAELLRKDLGRAHPALLETRARDEEALTKYTRLAPNEDKYRLPVTRAMELLVAKPALLAPRPKPAGQPAKPAGQPAKPAGN